MSLPKINDPWPILPEVDLQEADGTRGRYRCTGAKVLPKGWARTFLEWVGLVAVEYSVSYEFKLMEPKDEPSMAALDLQDE